MWSPFHIHLCLYGLFFIVPLSVINTSSSTSTVLFPQFIQLFQESCWTNSHFCASSETRSVQLHEMRELLFYSLSISNNIKDRKSQLFQCLIHPWLFLLLCPHFYFTTFHFLVINSWFKGKPLWLMCLWMTFVLISQVVLVELGSWLSWEVGNSLTSSGKLQGWVPQVKV